MNNADMPAMPVVESCYQCHATMDQPNINYGLTKLEHFAGLAMQGLLAGGYCINDPQNRMSDVGEEAIGIAEVILAKLDKENGK